MAAEQTPDGEAKPAHYPPFLYGFNRVLGTGRGESAAGGEKRGHKRFVAPEEQNHQAGYRTARPCRRGSCRRKAAPVHIATAHARASAALTAASSKEVAGQEKSGRTVTTTSQDCGKMSRCSRKTSLNMRLILLRCTAPRTRRWTLIPSRLVVRPLARKTSEKPAPFNRLPFLYTCANSLDFLIRLSLGSPNLFTGSHGQALSAFGPAASDDGPASPCTHAHQKTVGPLAFCIAGLKCLFTHRENSFSGLRQASPASRWHPGVDALSSHLFRCAGAQE